MCYNQTQYMPTTPIPAHPQMPVTPQYPQMMSQNTSPQWAMDMMADMKILKDLTPKTESIDKTVSTINRKLDLELKVNQMDEKVMQVENACSFVSGKYEEQSVKQKSFKGTN